MPCTILRYDLSTGWRTALIWMASSAHAEPITRRQASALLRSELNAEHPFLELPELVAHPRGFLELEVARVLQHLLLEHLDLARELLLRHRLVAHGVLGRFRVLGFVHAVDQVLDALHHALRRNAMLLVVADLLRAPPIGLSDGSLDRVRHLVGIEDRRTVDVPRRAADGLDQRALRAQESLLVGVEDRDQRHLRQVEAFAQQVDADEHVELAEAQVTDDLHPLHRLDLRVQIAHLHAVFGKVLGQLLRHALGERGDQHALVLLHADADLREEIVDLARRRADDDLRVDEARGPHDLLQDRVAGLLALVIRRRGGDERGLAHHVLELIEAQGPVVQRRRQAKAVFDEIFLARAVALVHAAELRDRDMTLVDDHQRVGREIVDERRRRLARQTAGEVARVVLDALAEAKLGEHFQIESRALLDPLRLHQAPGVLEELDALAQLRLDRLDGAQRRLARRHVMAGRVHGEARHWMKHPAGERIENLQLFDLVVEERDSHGMLRVLGRKHVDHVAAHPEGAAAEIELAPRVLHGHQAREHVALGKLLALAQVQDHAVVLGRVTDTVDRRYGGDDHHIAPLEQRLGRREAHLLDVVVDRRVFLDVQVPRRHISLRLVVVVVRDEVLDGVLRKELAELRVELRRQRLVRREHQRRPAEARDHVRHRVGLARAGDAEQRLVREPVVDAFGELVDRLRLVARRLERLVQAEGTVWKGDDVHAGFSGATRYFTN